MRMRAPRTVAAMLGLGVTAALVSGIGTAAYAADGNVSGCVVDKTGAPAAGVFVGVFKPVHSLPDNPQHPGVDYQKIGIDLWNQAGQAGIDFPVTGADGCFAATMPAGDYEFAFLDFVNPAATPRYGLAWYDGPANGYGDTTSPVTTSLARIGDDGMGVTAVTVPDSGSVALGRTTLQDAATLRVDVTGALANIPREYAGVALYTDVHKVVNNTGSLSGPYQSAGEDGVVTIGGVPAYQSDGTTPVTYRVRIFDTRHGAVTDYMYGPNGGVQTEVDNVHGPFLAFDDHGTENDPWDDTWVAGVSPVTLVAGSNPSPLSFALPPVSTYVTNLETSAAAVTEGEPVSLTATVMRSDQSSGDLTQSPAGRVGFYEGATLLGSAALSTGTATLTVNSLPANGDGSPLVHSITARYLGVVTAGNLTTLLQDEYAPSAPSTPVLVTASAAPVSPPTPVATTTTLTATPATTVPGSSVTLSAKVSASAGTPTGTVTFAEGSTIFGTASVNGAGVATLVTPSLGAGHHTITAAYTSNISTAFTDSQGSVAVVVAAAGVTSPPPVAAAPRAIAVLKVSKATVKRGAKLSIVTVVSKAGAPVAGRVTIKDGRKKLATVKLNKKGKAVVVTRKLKPGKHKLVAVYSGDGTATTSVIVVKVRR